MPVEETKIVTASSVSARIIAAGIVIAFLYWASSVLVTLIVSVLLAYFLDPLARSARAWFIAGGFVFACAVDDYRMDAGRPRGSVRP
jgi:predicted PurR-regulated permease PerM